MLFLNRFIFLFLFTVVITGYQNLDASEHSQHGKLEQAEKIPTPQEVFEAYYKKFHEDKSRESRIIDFYGAVHDYLAHFDTLEVRQEKCTELFGVFIQNLKSKYSQSWGLNKLTSISVSNISDHALIASIIDMIGIQIPANTKEDLSYLLRELKVSGLRSSAPLYDSVNHKFIKRNTQHLKGWDQYLNGYETLVENLNTTVTSIQDSITKNPKGDLSAQGHYVKKIHGKFKATKDTHNIFQNALKNAMTHYNYGVKIAPLIQQYIAISIKNGKNKETTTKRLTIVINTFGDILQAIKTTFDNFQQQNPDYIQAQTEAFKDDYKFLHALYSAIEAEENAVNKHDFTQKHSQFMDTLGTFAAINNNNNNNNNNTEKDENEPVQTEHPQQDSNTLFLTFLKDFIDTGNIQPFKAYLAPQPDAEAVMQFIDKDFTLRAAEVAELAYADYHPNTIQNDTDEKYFGGTRSLEDGNYHDHNGQKVTCPYDGDTMTTWWKNPQNLSWAERKVRGAVAWIIGNNEQFPFQLLPTPATSEFKYCRQQSYSRLYNLFNDADFQKERIQPGKEPLPLTKFKIKDKGLFETTITLPDQDKTLTPHNFIIVGVIRSTRTSFQAIAGYYENQANDIYIAYEGTVFDYHKGITWMAQNLDADTLLTNANFGTILGTLFSWLHKEFFKKHDHKYDEEILTKNLQLATEFARNIIEAYNKKNNQFITPAESKRFIITAHSLGSYYAQVVTAILSKEGGYYTKLAENNKLLGIGFMVPGAARNQNLEEILQNHEHRMNIPFVANVINDDPVSNTNLYFFNLNSLATGVTVFHHIPSTGANDINQHSINRFNYLLKTPNPESPGIPHNPSNKPIGIQNQKGEKKSIKDDGWNSPVFRQETPLFQVKIEAGQNLGTIDPTLSYRGAPPMNNNNNNIQHSNNSNIHTSPKQSRKSRDNPPREGTPPRTPPHLN